jgi:hypothetical protein
MLWNEFPMEDGLLLVRYRTCAGIGVAILLWASGVFV